MGRPLATAAGTIPRPPSPAWMASAACAYPARHGLARDAWFTSTPTALTEDEQRARDVCREQCPVRAECLDYAVATDQRAGTWAGVVFDRLTGPAARTGAIAHEAAAAAARAALARQGSGVRP